MKRISIQNPFFFILEDKQEEKNHKLKANLLVDFFLIVNKVAFNMHPTQRETQLTYLCIYNIYIIIVIITITIYKYICEYALCTGESFSYPITKCTTNYF